jgi:hypothetical protein
MGHQVNYFLVPKDISELEASIQRLEPMVVLHHRSVTATPRVLPSVEFREDGQRLLFYCLVRASDLSQVITKFVKAQGYWTVDVLRSPVVEFDSCYFDGKIIRRGRLYYNDGFFNLDETWIEKPESFRFWAKAVMKVTKKAMCKHGADYIGHNALAWLNSNCGMLVT